MCGLYDDDAVHAPADLSEKVDAIARELAELPTDMHWAENADLTARMDGYIAGLK